MPATLTLPEAAQYVGLDPARFTELVAVNYWPQPIARDPAAPVWVRDELTMCMKAQDRERAEKMIFSGLYADAEPKPTGPRIQSMGRYRKAKQAGATHMALYGRGARSYRHAPSDYRLWLPLPPTQKLVKRLIQELDMMFPELMFAVDDGSFDGPSE